MDLRGNGLTETKRQAERGNVLFLILIAVALFAALSYAVTQSTRSGGGDASNETNLVNSSQITQYPASLKTSITRMNISNSVSVDQLLFDPPPYTGLANTDYPYAVFHPTGGGATYQTPPANVMLVTTSVWAFNAANEVKNIGTDGASDGSSRDIIAFLPDIKKAICDKINAQLGIGTSITETAAIDMTGNMNKANAGIAASATTKIIGGVAGSASLAGKPQGCVKIGATYNYFSVLVER